MSAYYQYFTIIINIIIGLTAVIISAVFVGLILYGIYILTENK